MLYTSSVGNTLTWNAVAIEVVVNGAWVVVEAEVTRLAPDDYVVIWEDLEAVHALGFSCARLSYLVNRFEEQARWLEWEREAAGIEPLLDDVSPVHSAGRDQRISEVA